jgi:hypothetical protein
VPAGERVDEGRVDAAGRVDLQQIAEVGGLLGFAPAGGGAMNAAWFTLLGRAVARGEAPAEAVHPRVAALPMTLLRGEYAVRGVPAVPDEVLLEIVDEVFLPLVRGRAS